MQSASSAARAHSFVAKGRGPAGSAARAALDARRADVLRRQQEGRVARLQTVRDIVEMALNEATAAEAEAEAATGAASPAASFPSPAASHARSGRLESAAHRLQRQQYASQLSQPSWMESLPSDAALRWLLQSRAEGARVHVVARRGRTVSRNKNGSMLHTRFSSILPHGGASLAGRPGAVGGVVAVAGASSAEDACPATALDCVWNEASASFIVIDCLVFNNYHLADATAEFRMHWLWQKFIDMGAVTFAAPMPVAVPPAAAPGAGAPPSLRWLTLPASPHSPYAFHLLESVACTAEHLGAVYPHDPRLRAMDIRQDGYLLLHKEAFYPFGLSDMCLQWKDAQCSPYLINSTSSPGGGGGGAAPKQAVTLRLVEGRRLECEEGRLVAYLDELTYQTASVRVNDLLLFSIDGIDESEELETAAAAAAAAAASSEGERKEAPASGAAGAASSGGSGSGSGAVSPVEKPAVRFINLTFLKKASPARVQPDSLNKIMYQYHARTGQLLPFDEIFSELRQQAQAVEAMQLQHADSQAATSTDVEMA